jgi:predicted transcriptional regulator
MVVEERIVIRSVGKPTKQNLDSMVVWFCQSLDLAGSREAVETEILKEIIGSSASGDGVTSKELNNKLETPRTTVIYHLNRFISSGLIVRKGRKYYLRSEDMVGTLEELQADMEREFQRLVQVAAEMDQILEGGLHGRKKTRRR